MNAPLSLPLDDIDRRLVDEFQRDVALVARPFAVLGAALGLGEEETIVRLSRLIARGAVSRFGAVVRPHAAGASTLAALSAPSARLDEIADLVSAFPGVTHNYAREHVYNLWFVVTGRSRVDVAATLAAIEQDAGLPVLDLPLERAFHIDLGFSMFGARAPKARAQGGGGSADPIDRSILAAIEHGVALVPQPFAQVADELGLSESEVLARLARMLAAGVVTRFGVVVRHRAFGYRANAMAVWDVADVSVDSIAEHFARDPAVTLCYRRPRRLPHWRYNLFCMIHAKDRGAALATIETLKRAAGAPVRDQATLFSTHCYKQRGASFSATA